MTSMTRRRGGVIVYRWYWRRRHNEIIEGECPFFCRLGPFFGWHALVTLPFKRSHLPVC